MGEQNSWERSGCGTKKKHWLNDSLSRWSFSRFSAVILSPVGDNCSRNVRCVRNRKHQECYAIVIRRDPESILVVDRSLITRLDNRTNDVSRNRPGTISF